MEAQFLERTVDGWVARCAFDIGKEFRGGKACAVLIAFKLCHIDAVCRKAAHRLIQSGRDVLDLKNEGGHQRAGEGAAIDWRA